MNKTSAATGTKPAASVDRSDAALPGATCAHYGSPAGTTRGHARGDRALVEIARDDEVTRESDDGIAGRAG